MRRIWTRTNELIRGGRRHSMRISAGAVPASRSVSVSAGLRDSDMRRALADTLRRRLEAEKNPAPERDREQRRRLVRWAESKSCAVNGSD